MTICVTATHVWANILNLQLNRHVLQHNPGQLTNVTSFNKHFYLGLIWFYN